MDATKDELDALFEIQQADFDILHMNRDLDELPQREVILASRKKRETVNKKIAQIGALKKESEKKLSRITTEDLSLQKKESGTQAAIEAAGNDFRNVEARTKELNGIFKRRQELSEQVEAVKEEIAKIDALYAQAAEALSEIDAVEQEATETFKAQGGMLKVEINDAEKKKTALLESLRPELAEAYVKTSERMGTVAVGRLEGTRCGVCRAPIDTGRLIELRNQAPLSYCPICKRLLVIEEQ